MNLKTVNFYSQRLFRAVFPGRHTFDTLLTGEVEFQKLAISNLREGEVVVDAGPRVDTWLAELSAKRSLKTYLIEASPRFAKRLRSDVAHLNTANVINTGLSDESSAMDYFLLTQSFDPNLGFPNLGIRRVIKLAPLDSLIPQGEAVGFLKTDVEGFDFGVLLGAKRILARLNFLQFEYSRSWKGNSITVQDYLNLVPGMVPFLLRDDENPFFDVYPKSLVIIPYEPFMEERLNAISAQGPGFNFGLIRSSLPELVNDLKRSSD